MFTNLFTHHGFLYKHVFSELSLILNMPPPDELCVVVSSVGVIVDLVEVARTVEPWSLHHSYVCDVDNLANPKNLNIKSLSQLIKT